MTATNNETQYTTPERNEVKSKTEWLDWFAANGNHDADGWSDAETWFTDMLRNGDLIEVNN